MERRDQVKICQQCKHRKMNFSRGLLCGLTDEFADFEGSCESFEKDGPTITTHTTDQVFFEEEDTSTKPIHGKDLGIFILAIILLSFILPLLLEKITSSIPVLDGYHYFRFYSLAFLSWFFIGKVTLQLKNAIIAGLVHLVVFGLLEFLPLPNFILREITPIIISSTCFSLLVFTDKKKVVKFVLTAIIIFLSISPLYFPQLELLTRQFRAIFRNHADREFFGQMIFVLSNISLYTLPFILLSLTYAELSKANPSRFKLNNISLYQTLTNKSMALFVFIFYSSILLISFLLLENIKNLLGFATGSISFVDWETGISYVLFLSIKNILSFGLLICLSWYFRKITLSYYLANNQPISWGYFFAMMPIINIIIWIVNLSNFKRVATFDRNTIAELLNVKSLTLVTIIIFLSLAQAMLPLLLSNTRVEVWDIFALVISLILVLLYLNNQYGIYIAIGFETLFIILLIVLELYGFKTPKEAIGISIFFGIARLILIYPVFHGNAFTVALPKTTVDESL